MRTLFVIIALLTQTPEKVWFLGIDGQQQGPLTSVEVEKLIKGGKVKGETLCWKEGQPQWIPLKDAPAFRTFFVTPPPLPPPQHGAPPPLPPAAPPPGPGREVIGAPPAPEPEPDIAAAEPVRPRSEERTTKKDTRDERTRKLRALREARDRSAAASDGFRTTALVWGGTAVGLGGAGAVAGLFAATSSDPTLRPGCSVLSCALCLGCGGSALTGAVLSGLKLKEMADADAEVAAAEANTSAMRY